MATLEHSISILIASEETLVSSSEGNPYRTYDTAVKALSDKYDGTAQWGGLQAGNIVDVRSAFIIGQGVKVVAEKGAEREKEWVDAFVRHNNLDEEMPQELAKEAEIEGRALIRLVPNVPKKQIDIRFISYVDHHYKVETAPDDYAVYTQAKYRPSKEQSEVTIPAEEFVYKKFAGRVNRTNVMPKVAKVLRQVEDLDKALDDWRKINRLFAAPTPYFECETAAAVTSLKATLKELNWKIGKALVGTAKFSLIGPSGEGVTSLENEIITLAKMISGATGVPVHFLGLPDLMSNRAVSTDLFEFINASTNKEREVWAGVYEEMFVKAMLLANAKFQAGLKPEERRVRGQILNITEAKIKELVEIWMPLYQAKIVDLDYVLRKIPDADPETMKAAIQKAQTQEAVQLIEEIRRREREADSAGADAGGRGNGNGNGNRMPAGAMR